MQPWLETLGVMILAFLGGVLGLKASRLRKPYWALGYAFPLLLLIIIGLVRHIARLRFVAGLSWAAAGRNEFVILSLAVPMVFATLIPRLVNRRQKILVSILLAVATAQSSIFPFLVPPLIRNHLAALQTHITADSVCLQTTGYTCGPASAVTALKQLGIEAQEGEIAILAHTTPIHGTADDLLSQAIEKRYGSEGVSCHYRHFNSIAQLKETCPTIAVVKFAPLIDHYITILEVSDDYVIVADPLAGKQTLTHKEFKDKWRFIGIVVKWNKEKISGSLVP